MIIKILGSSNSFNGVDYNEKKVKEGVAERIGVRNFDNVNDLEAPNIKEQLEIHTSLNNSGRLVNKQFHVALSVEGNSMDKNELMNIGEKYMEFMGYESNPYLIYFHSDTDNNHIHIVSSRINTEGKKINDSFENKRTLSFINKELGIDYSKSKSKDIERLLAYNYSSKNQIKSFASKMNMDLSIKDDIVKVYYGNSCLNEINIQDFKIDPRLKNNKTDVNRIKAILYKYKSLIPNEYLNGFLKEKFGYDIHINNTRNYRIKIDGNNLKLFGSDRTLKLNEDLLEDLNNAPQNLYELRDSISSINKRKIEDFIMTLEPKEIGYTFIDNKNKSIYKGSDLLKLSVLREEPIKEIFNQDILNYVCSLGIEEYVSYVKKNNGEVDSSLNIIHKGNFYELKDDVKINMIKKSLSNKMENMTMEKELDYNHILNHIASSGVDVKEFLSTNNLSLHKDIDNQIICVNEDKQTISPVNDEFGIYISDSFDGLWNQLSTLLYLFHDNDLGEDQSLNNRKKIKKKKKKKKL